ncbi:MAG: hypothetical protein BWK76_18980 [Desulfobulbaceae bacterium A2]|nr:MAG: hypothetical protein BWK76_18980 [Desulfobulbaceae bacterium A2]
MKAITIAAVLERMRPYHQEGGERGSKAQSGGTEIGWGLLSLVLFLLLGPFSVIAVLPALWRLATSDDAREASGPAPCV